MYGTPPLTSDDALVLERGPQAEAEVGVELGKGLHLHLDGVWTQIRPTVQ